MAVLILISVTIGTSVKDVTSKNDSSDHSDACSKACRLAILLYIWNVYCTKSNHGCVNESKCSRNVDIGLPERDIKPKVES